jgi:hypothetical protein
MAMYPRRLSSLWFGMLESSGLPFLLRILDVPGLNLFPENAYRKGKFSMVFLSHFVP